VNNILFQTDSPTENRGRVEFYELNLFERSVAGREFFFVRVIRGWWDNEARRPHFDADSCVLTEPIERHFEAIGRYYSQRLSYVNRGFIHSFQWHPTKHIPSFHQRIDELAFDDLSDVAENDSVNRYFVPRPLSPVGQVRFPEL
jgi:hypothetical protein